MKVSACITLSRLDDTMARVDIKVARGKMKLESLLNELRIFENDSSRVNLRSILDECELKKNRMATDIGRVKRCLLLNQFEHYNEKKNNFCQLMLLNLNEK